MLGFAEMMPDFFGLIVGPGHNREHMNHFHVELFANADRHALRAIAEYADQPEWVAQRVQISDPDWPGAAM